MQVTSILLHLGDNMVDCWIIYRWRDVSGRNNHGSHLPTRTMSDTMRTANLPPQI